MKPCMSHYSHKSIPDGKFEADSSSSFRDMMSQNFPRKKERVIEFGYVSFSNFQAEENFFIFKIFGTSRWEKSSSNPPDWSILLKFGQNVS